MNRTCKSPSQHGGTLVLRLIAATKLLKSAALIAIGAGALRVARADIAQVVYGALHSVHLDPGGRHIHQLLTKVLGVSPHTLRQISFGAFFYAALFVVEGVGLWLERRWAEYLTILSTSLLVPVEMVELVRQVTATRMIVLGLNMAVVVYLIFRLRNSRRAAPCPAPNDH